MSALVASRFPVLLVDEAQDTTKMLLPSIINITQAREKDFTLGLFGDVMQKIYLDGVENLNDQPLHTWAKISPLNINYRSDTRIVELANTIRLRSGSNLVQTASSSNPGCVRLFTLPRDKAGAHTEALVKRYMMSATGDNLWDPEANSDRSDPVKSLVLEHRLAAERLGFLDFYDALRDSPVGDRLFGRADDLPTILLYLKSTADLIGHIAQGRLRQADRLLTDLRTTRSSSSAEPVYPGVISHSNRETDKSSAQAFLSTVRALDYPKIADVLSAIRSTGVLELPPELADYLDLYDKSLESDEDSELFSQLEPSIGTSRDGESSTRLLEAWRQALAVEFSQVESFLRYRDGRSGFDTHQGVKGLEFPRVLVILDDSRARGRLFKFDKLFLDRPSPTAGREKPSAPDQHTDDRVRRLLYVACTRAEHGLAVVYYGDPNPKLSTEVRELFRESEIVDWSGLVSHVDRFAQW